MITHKEYLKAKDIVLRYRDQLKENINDCNNILAEHDTPLNDLDLSVRVYNCLRYAGCKTLMDVITIPLRNMRKERQWGKKCEDELIKFKVKYRGD